MGDALINGKLRLAGLAPPSGPGISGGDGNTRNEFYLWHFFGDPSMKMWGGGGDPIVFNPAQIKAVFKSQPEGPVPPNPPPYFVKVSLPAGLNGQPISLIHDGVVVGKAIVSGDQAEIPADFDGKQPNSSEQLQVALDADGSVPVWRRSGTCRLAPPPPVDTTVTRRAARTPGRTTRFRTPARS